MVYCVYHYASSYPIAVNAVNRCKAMKPVEVTFRYDEASRLWDIFVTGVTSTLEARQAFNAVVITAGEATPHVDANRAEQQTDGVYKISVGL